MFPSAGGVWVYLRQTYGAAMAWLYGWAVMIALDTGAVAALAAAFATYLGQLVELPPFARKAASAALILVLTVANCIGVRFGKRMQNLFAICKFGGVPAFGVPLLAALWAYFAWHTVCYSAAEFRHPQQDLPRALLKGSAIVTPVLICWQTSRTTPCFHGMESLRQTLWRP